MLTPALLVTTTVDQQLIHVTSSAVFGAHSVVDLDGIMDSLTACYRQRAPAAEILYHNIGPNLAGFRVRYGLNRTTQLTASGMTPALTVGTYEIGLCGQSDGGFLFGPGVNDIGQTYTTAIVLNPL
jgi:hypothetical protein